MTKTDDTLDKEIDEILDEHEHLVTGTPKHWEKTPKRKMLDVARNEKLKSLIADREKKAEVRGSLKQLRSDRRHQADVWGDNRDNGYYKQEERRLQESEGEG